MTQNASADGLSFVAFSGPAGAHAAVYHRAGGGASTKSLFGHGAQITEPEATRTFGANTWGVVGTSKSVQGVPHAGTYHVYGFTMEKNGATYYGYGRGATAAEAKAAAEALLNALR